MLKKNLCLDYIEVNAFGRQALYSTDGNDYCFRIYV